MNILFVLNSGNPGGMEQHVLDLVQGLMPRGHKVFVVCPEGSFARQYESAGALVTYLAPILDIDPFYILKIRRLIREYGIDLVHTHELKAGVNGMLGAYLAKVPVVTHTHTPISEWQISAWKKWLDVKIYSALVNRLSCVEIALTESRKAVKIQEGIAPQKLRVLPNGVNVNDFAFSPQLKNTYSREIRSRYNIDPTAFVFGLISRLSVEKGHFVLLEAYDEFKSILVQRGIEDSSHLFLGGGGALEEELRDFIRVHSLDTSVTITGRFSVEDHPKFYATLDAFIFPSFAEGFGIVLLEAMASRLPVVCSDLEVLREVGGSTVRYFDTGNSHDLAERMLDLYLRPKDYKPLANQAQQRVMELFSLESFIDRYIKLYGGLV